MSVAIDSIAQKLKDKFGTAPFDLSDMCLIEPGVDTNIVKAAEEQLALKFPAEMAQLLEKFDFSKLSLSNCPKVL